MESIVTVLALIGAIFSGIAAIAAISSAYWTRQQAEIAKAAAARKQPVLTTGCSAIEGQKDWYEIYLSVRNYADALVTLHSARAVSPAGTVFVYWEDGHTSNNYGETYPMNPMPMDKAMEEIDIEMHAAQDQERGSRRTFYAHIPPPSRSRFRSLIGGKQTSYTASVLVSIEFTLFFNDAIDRPFTITQKIRPPLIMA